VYVWKKEVLDVGGSCISPCMFLLTLCERQFYRLLNEGLVFGRESGHNLWLAHWLHERCEGEVHAEIEIHVWHECWCDGLARGHSRMHAGLILVYVKCVNMDVLECG